MATRREEVKVTADVSNFVTGMATAGAAAKAFGSTLTQRLDQADGRMANIVQASLALGPALIPLGAAAVPAIAGLSTQLGFAALAAGTAVLAFQGVGTALKAMSTFQAAPTAANLQKLNAAMSQLAPAGQEFVLTLDKLRPKLKALQATAQAGLFPGLTTGLGEVLDLLPKVNGIVDTTARALGDMAVQAGKGLHDQAFTEFFDYLQKTARPILMEMGATFGNFIEGITHLITAFDPLSRSFSTGLLGVAQAFNKWAAGLSKTQGFENFVDYIRTNSPAALTALGSLANALVQIIEAGAPIGHALLPVITALGNGLAALANSSLGPGIIGIASAIGILGRSLSLLEVVGLRGTATNGFGRSIQEGYTKPIKGVIPAMREMAAAQKEMNAAQRASFSKRAIFLSNPKTVGDYTSALLREVDATEKVSAAEKTRGTALREGAAAAGKAGALVGGLALATSGLGDKTGFANTATLALMGSVGGLPGIIAGGALGAMLDMAQANDSFDASARAATRSLQEQPAAFTDNAAAINDAQKKYEDFQSSIGKGGPKILRTLKATFNPASWKNFTKDAFGTSDLENMQNKLRDMRDQAAGTKNAVGQMYEAFGKGDAAKASTADLGRFINDLVPALQRVGLTAQDVFGGADPLGIKRVFGEVTIPFANALDQSTAGKSAAIGTALGHLRREVTDTIDPVDALKSALDNLFGVNIDASQAADDAIRALKDMRKALKDTNGQLFGNGAKQLDARDKVRAYAKAQLAVAESTAKATRSGKAAGDALIQARTGFISAARAAGVSEGAIKKMIGQMKLTPKNLVTIIKQEGGLSSLQKAIAIGRVYGKMPKTVKTIISEAGAHPTAKTIDALAKKYHTTPKAIRTILSAVDNATRKAVTARANAKKLIDTYKATLAAKDDASKKAVEARKKALALAKQWIAHLDAKDAASPATRAALALIRQFDGSRADAYIYTHRVTILDTQRADHNRATFAPPPGSSAARAQGKSATGGYITGPGTSTSDSIPTWLSDGEFVIRAAAVQKYGVGHFAQLNAMALAQGGHVTRRGYAKGGSVTGLVDNSTELTRVASELRELRKELKTQRNSKNTRKLRNEYAASTAANFIADPFSGTLGGFNNQIASETKKLAGTQTDLRSLKRAGLSGGLLKDLAASGNSALIHQFAGLNKAQIASEEAAYRHRNNLSLAVGHEAANMAFPSIHELKHEIHVLAHELHQLRHGKHLGNHVTNFNGKVSAKDTEALAKKIHEKQRQAARLARNA